MKKTGENKTPREREATSRHQIPSFAWLRGSKRDAKTINKARKEKERTFKREFGGARGLQTEERGPGTKKQEAPAPAVQSGYAGRPRSKGKKKAVRSWRIGEGCSAKTTDRQKKIMKGNSGH